MFLAIYIHLLEINAYSLVWVLYSFLSLMVLVFIFILFFSFFKRKLENKKKLWQEKVTNVISQSIFFENKENEVMEVNLEDNRFLKNYSFRQYFTNEIIHAKKNLSGSPISNLIQLYEMLELDKDSLKKLRSKKWHIKAKGLQELSLMEQHKYVKQIFRLTNDENGLVRNEAQCALVNFYGFKGLRFLNVVVHPISQWQQMQLLNYLHDLQDFDANQLKKWLQSENHFVVTLALRLSSLYNCREVYNEVIKCLQFDNDQVKLNALVYLKKINGEGTPDAMIQCFANSGRVVKLSILAALQETAHENQIPFLLKQLHNFDDTIKLEAAKTLSIVHPLGPAFLQEHLFADEYPWNVIFNQIENEHAA